MGLTAIKLLTTLDCWVSHSQHPVPDQNLGIDQELVGPLARVKKNSNFTDDGSDLYSLLRKAIDVDRGKEQQTESSFHDSTEFYLMMKTIFAAQLAGKEVVDDVAASSATPRNQAEDEILAFPFWRINLLLWACQCLGPSSSTKAFGHRLEENGATSKEPFIVKMYASTTDPGLSLWRALSEQESIRITTAWLKAFPDYIIAGFPREVCRLLTLVRESTGRGDQTELELDPVGIADACAVMKLFAAGPFGEDPFAASVGIESRSKFGVTEACVVM